MLRLTTANPYALSKLINFNSATGVTCVIKTHCGICGVGCYTRPTHYHYVLNELIEAIRLLYTVMTITHTSGK